MYGESKPYIFHSPSSPFDSTLKKKSDSPIKCLQAPPGIYFQRVLTPTFPNNFV